MRIAALILFATALLAAPVQERPAIPGAAGPNRLALDVSLLAEAKPLRYAGEVVTGGLEDLRLFDSQGREVPYLLIAPERREDRWRRATLLPIQPTKTTSGFEAGLGGLTRTDRIRLRGLPAPLLKPYRLEGSGDRRRWVLLVSEGTLFDLPQEQLRNLEASFRPGEYRYLRITWDDRSSARVGMPSGLEARIVEQLVPFAPERIVIPFQKRESEPGKSRYRLTLPGSNLPVRAIEPSVRNTHVFRGATVTESRLSGGEITPAVLGMAHLRRTERDGAIASEMHIPVLAPSEPDLELVVDDGDNPPLDITQITAELAPLPYVYFEAASVEPLVARYGDPALNAPRYDLEATRQEVRKRTAAEARWGEPRHIALVAERTVEDLPLAGYGARIETAEFRYQRPIPQGSRGLTSLLLDAAVLSRSRDLSDVRIVTADGRQVPYLLEKRGEPVSLELAPVKAMGASGRISRYEIEMPYPSLPEARLVLSTSQRIFERNARLVLPRERDEVTVLANAAWRHADPRTEPPKLTLSLPRIGTTQVLLEIDEGDNAPLPLDRPRLLLPSYRLRFLRPAEEELLLVYGNDKVARPRYDVALLAPRLLGASAREIQLGAEGAQRRTIEIQRAVFWVAIATAVAVLLVMMGRMLRREPAS